MLTLKLWKYLRTYKYVYVVTYVCSYIATCFPRSAEIAELIKLAGPPTKIPVQMYSMYVCI